MNILCDSNAQKKFRLAIFCPSTIAPSETFISAHTDCLRAFYDVIPVYGADWSSRLENRLLFGRRVSWLGRAIQQTWPEAGAVIWHVLLGWRLRILHVDAILAEYGTIGASIATAAENSQIPLIVLFRGFDATNQGILQKYCKAYRALFASKAIIIAVSPSLKTRIESIGYSGGSIQLNTGGGVNQKLFCGADPAKSESLFVAVGRFVEKKAPHLTILAFSRVAEQCPLARLVMIGDGPLFGACKLLATSLGLADRVEFLGSQPPEKVAETMRRGRAFIQHSVKAADGDSEGTPISVMEAQLCGLPVVATAHGGIPEVVVHEHTGFLVPEGDITQMAHWMLQLCLDPQLAGVLGDSARRRAIERYTLDAHILELSRIVQSAIHENRRRGA